MIDEITDWLKTRQREIAEAREKDRPRRLKALNPDAAAYWISVLDRAEPFARAADWKRPCDYAPWEAALNRIAEVDKDWPNFGFPIRDPGPVDLMHFAADAASPGWPEDHAHLVDFALRFLEADVMLFRSGYTKRHLLRRLRQARWNDPQTKRAEALVRRAVQDGTGLEEFREFCRLTPRVITDDLRDWLEDQADRAFLTLNDLDGADYFHWMETLGEANMRKLSRHGFSLNLQNAFAADPPHSVVKIKDLPQDNRIRRNAWRMLRYIRRRGI